MKDEYVSSLLSNVGLFVYPKLLDAFPQNLVQTKPVCNHRFLAQDLQVSTDTSRIFVMVSQSVLKLIWIL